MQHVLSIIIFLPIVVGFLILFIKNELLVQYVSILSCLFIFILSVILFIQFDNNFIGMQFQELIPWIINININYHVGVDGISMPLVVLNSFITLVVMIASYKLIKHRVALYNTMFLFSLGLVNGVFCSLDAILFYIFFESMLIPMYFIIGIWGGKNRIYAAFKFFLYTLLGSLLMLIAIIYLYYNSEKSFEILDYFKTPLAFKVQILLFIAFFSGFALKVPMWPVHTWLPDAHPEAPTCGSMILAAITLKVGGYGFYRFILPIVPDASRYLANLMIILSFMAIVYISLVALVQKDMKKLVAYSSIAHMGFVTLGVFMFFGNVLNPLALEGGLLQMLSHGFISAALFMCIGIIYDKVHSKEIKDFGGLATKMPGFASLFLLFILANSGLPGTSGFVGEFMVIMGVSQVHFGYAVIAASILILGASYSLWMYKRVVFGSIANQVINKITDANLQEFLVLGLLAVAVLIMGIYPQLFIAKMEVSVRELILHVANTKLNIL